MCAPGCVSSSSAVTGLGGGVKGREGLCHHSSIPYSSFQAVCKAGFLPCMRVVHGLLGDALLASGFLVAHSPCPLQSVPHDSSWANGPFCLLRAMSKSRNSLGKVSNGLGQGTWGSCSFRFWEPDFSSLKGCGYRPQGH